MEISLYMKKYIIDYQEGGSMTDHLKQGPLSEAQSKTILMQLLLTLNYIHRKNIIHRDIKPDNILINKIEEEQHEIRIADFGLATFGHILNNSQTF
jgi:serine/threonine protein kinase